MLNLPKKISSLIKKQDRKIDCLLGKITNLKQIGQGGNGIVYEGLLHSKPIAIKFFTKLDSTNKLTRFKAEYFNIVLLPANEMTTKYINFDILDIDEQKIPYIIMDKYDKTLKNLREEENKPNIDELFNFLLDSVEFIHNKKVIEWLILNFRHPNN